MSREIKFRAWDKEEKEYYYNAEYTYDFLCSGRGCCAESFGDVLDQPKRFVVEQYTGLKDKNSKEICIGDVISERHGDIIGEIIQKPSGEYRIAWIGIYGGESVLYDHHLLCEVIGNIHENPELLGGEE